MAEAAAGKARLPTVESLTDGTMRVDHAPGSGPNFCDTNADARSVYGTAPYCSHSHWKLDAYH